MQRMPSANPTANLNNPSSPGREHFSRAIRVTQFFSGNMKLGRPNLAIRLAGR